MSQSHGTTAEGWQETYAAFTDVHDLTTRDSTTEVCMFIYGSLGWDLADIWWDRSLDLISCECHHSNSTGSVVVVLVSNT